MKTNSSSIFAVLVIIALFSTRLYGQLNLVQPTTISATAAPFTFVSTPMDIIVDPIITPTTDPTTTTVSSYSDGSGFDNVYIWQLTANTITMRFAAPVDITGVAIWNAFASGAYADPGFLEPDHSVKLANFEFFSGGASLGNEDVNVLFPDDAFGELYPFALTYNDVDQIIMKVITNHGGNETAMQEIAFNSTSCDAITTIISSKNICIGESVTIEGISETGGVITWDGGIANGVEFTPLVAGKKTYTATSTSADDCPFSVEITVSDLPIVTAAVDDIEICLGESVTFKGGGADTYTWDAGVVNGVPYKPAAVGTVTYTVVGVKKGTDCKNSASVDVTVHALPVVTAGVDNIEICMGESVTFKGGGADTYSWDKGVVDGVAFTPADDGSVTYTVIGTNTLTGCKSTASVDVNVLKSLIISITASDTEICVGEAVILKGSGADTYVWDMGVENGKPFTPGSTGVFEYNVVGTSKSGGCTGKAVISITVHDLPAVSFSAPAVQGCAPFTANFNATSPGVSFGWIFGDGKTGVGAATSHTYNTPGSYDVKLTITSVFGCTNSNMLNDYITVEEVPVASFTYAPTDINIADTRVEFTNTSVGATHYEWTFDDSSPMSTVTHPIHIFPVIGNKHYTITLIAISDFGCQDIITNKITIKDALYYFIPNAFTPDGDSFNESFKPIFDAGLDLYDYHLTIYNKWGERVFESFNVDYGWNGTYGGSGEVVQDGTYVWSIQFGETMSDRNHDINGHVTVLK